MCVCVCVRWGGGCHSASAWLKEHVHRRKRWRESDFLSLHPTGWFQAVLASLDLLSPPADAKHAPSRAPLLWKLQHGGLARAYVCVFSLSSGSEATGSPNTPAGARGRRVGDGLGGGDEERAAPLTSSEGRCEQLEQEGAEPRSDEKPAVAMVTSESLSSSPEHVNKSHVPQQQRFTFKFV